jgi:hypothetical protein
MVMALAQPATGQQESGRRNVGPRIVILVPLVIPADLSARRQMDSIDRLLAQRREQDTHGLPDSAAFADSPTAARRTRDLPGAYLNNVHHLEQHSSCSLAVPALLQNVLMYSLGKRFRRSVVLVDEHARSHDVDSIRSLAKLDSADYVLAIDTVTVETSRAGWRMSAVMRAYEARTDSMRFRVRVTGDDRNQGGMFTCAEGTIHCAMMNCSAELWEKVFVLFLGPDLSPPDERKKR